MSEPNTPPKEGGLKPPPTPSSSDEGLNKTGGGVVRDGHGADDVERGDSPGGREGGMIGEG